jgi:NADH-quinone oxidoreductase subunit I/NAD(P)H-quinone oxidoreductase subunit I
MASADVKKTKSNARKASEDSLSARKYRYGKKERTKFIGIRGYIIRPMLYTLKQALKSTFGKQPDVFFADKRGTNTILYPNERMLLPDNYRGKNEVIWEKCIGCELCARVCPNKCIDMEEISEIRLKEFEERLWGPCRSTQNEKKALIKRPAIFFGRCMFCGNCEEYCPTGAMRMTEYFELADSERIRLYFEAEELMVKDYSGEDWVDLENKIRELPIVDSDNCTGCQLCMRNCPTRCIEMIEGPKLRKDRPIKNPKIDESQCVGCATCMSNCKFDALKMEAIR